MIVSGLIAFLNSLAVVGFYLLIKKYYGQIIAMLSSVSIALSPWSILFSRKIWNPDLILLFLLPFLYFLHRFLFDKDKKALFWLALFLALLCQLHFSGIYLGVIIVVIIWVYNKKEKLEHFSYSRLIGGLGVGLIPVLPWILGNLNSQPFCRDCVAFITYLKIPKSFDFYHLLRPWQFLNGLNFEMVLGKDYVNFLHTYPFIHYLLLLFWLELLVLGIGLTYIVRQKRQWLWLVLFTVLVPILYLLAKIPAYPYYFVILSPMVFVISALGWYFLSKLLKQTIWPYLIYALFLLIQLTHVIFMVSFFQFIQARQEINGDYGPIFTKTAAYIQSQVKQYETLPYYDELLAFAYVYKHPTHLNQQLGRYLALKGNLDAALDQFNKALAINPKDSYSRSMQAQIYLMQGNFDQAEIEITQLKTTDRTIASQLEMILQRKKLEQQLLQTK